MYLFRFNPCECVRAAALLLCVSASLSLAQLIEDKCEVNFYGQSYVGLDGHKSIFDEDTTTHTIEFLFNPRKGTMGEQSLLDTGIVKQKDASWAVEFKFKTTIWQQQVYPASSVIYIDEWSKQSVDTQWQKTRHYVVLGQESFPWLHISFTRGGEISINGKQRRLDRYSTVATESQPRDTFAFGEGFNGALDEIRVWKGKAPAYTASTLCVEDVKANLVLYFPFNECKGNMFAGFTQSGPVCATMRGSTQESPVWTHTSPVGSQTCASTLRLQSYCEDKPTPADDGDDHTHYVPPTENDEDSTNVLAAGAFNLLQPQTGGLLLVIIILAGVALLRVRTRTERPPVAIV